MTIESGILRDTHAISFLGVFTLNYLAKNSFFCLAYHLFANENICVFKMLAI